MRCQPLMIRCVAFVVTAFVFSTFGDPDWESPIVADASKCVGGISKLLNVMMVRATTMVIANNEKIGINFSRLLRRLDINWRRFVEKKAEDNIVKHSRHHPLFFVRDLFSHTP